MIGPKEEKAKILHRLRHTQLFEREKRAQFTMENQFMSLTQMKFSYCSVMFYTFGFNITLEWNFKKTLWRVALGEEFFPFLMCSLIRTNTLEQG